MDSRDKNMFKVCMASIVDKLKPGGKFKALLVKKNVLDPDIVDEIFDGDDKEDNAYEFVKKLRKQPPDVVTRFIETLEETNQSDLADMLKKYRRLDIETLRRGVKEALGKESQGKNEEGRIPIDTPYWDHCRKFASGQTDDVPGEFTPDRASESINITNKCAEELVALLGGDIETVLVRRDGGLLWEYLSDGEIKYLFTQLVIKSEGKEVLETIASRPNSTIQQEVEEKVPGYKKVTDATGKDVDVRKRLIDWWPGAPVGASGGKNLHVWTTEPPRPHDITPLKR